MQPTDEQGYLIVAIDTDSSDYVTNATLLASSIKYWHPDAKICLLTNATVANDTGLFAYVKPFRHLVNMANPWANDWQVFDATPFRETIKLEADMMITSAIDHWWTLLQHRDVVVSTGCRDWKDQRAVARHYRKIFDANNLPDVYNAITYWRLSRTAKTFFNTVRNIFENWEQYKTLLKFSEDIPSTDVVYAMAANIIGPELCTLPFATYPQIVHMKRHIAGSKTDAWLNEFLMEKHNHSVRINTIAQWGAVHHSVKNWDTV